MSVYFMCVFTCVCIYMYVCVFVFTCMVVCNVLGGRSLHSAEGGASICCALLSDGQEE